MLDSPARILAGSGTALALGLAMVAMPQAATASTVAASQTYQNVATGFCVDSNANRNLYTNPCGSGNNYQHWR